MSDLAPFVAAALKCKVVAEMKEECDQLRAEVEETRAAALRSAKRGGCVEITGEGGTPVYARGTIHTASRQRVPGDRKLFRIGLTNNTQAPCPNGKMLSAEVRVNGTRVANVGDADDFSMIDYFGDEINVRCRFDTARGTPWDNGFLVIIDIERSLEWETEERSYIAHEVLFSHVMVGVSDTSDGDALHDIHFED